MYKRFFIGWFLAWFLLWDVCTRNYQYTIRFLLTYCIVQQVQCKSFYFRHHVLLLLLSFRIMVHVTQKHHLSNLDLIKLSFLHTSIHSSLLYNSWQWCVVFGVLDVQHFYQIYVFKAISSLVLTGLALMFVYVWDSEYWWHQNIPHE